MIFQEARRMTAMLAVARAAGRNFDHAWKDSIAELRPPRELVGRYHSNWHATIKALNFARPAYRRAYYGEPPTAADSAAQTLAHAMESLYDDSDYAEPQFISLPEAA